MSRWQHFLHALGRHDWHRVEEWEAETQISGHGRFAPRRTEKQWFVKKVCCHCGEERIRTWAEWVGF